MSSGDPLLSEKDLSMLIEKCQHSFIDGKPISNYEARLETILNDAKELSRLSYLYNTALVDMIWTDIQMSGARLEKAYPEVFNAKINAKTASTPAFSALRKRLIDNIEDNAAKQNIINGIDNNAAFVDKLVNLKFEGKQLFSEQDINEILKMLYDPKSVPAIGATSIIRFLNDPEYIQMMLKADNRAIEMGQLIYMQFNKNR